MATKIDSPDTDSSKGKKVNKKSWNEMSKQEKRSGIIGLIIFAVIIIIVIVAVSSGGTKSSKNTANNTAASNSSTNNSSSSSSNNSSTPAVRQVEGTAATLGAGNFTVGVDVAPGLYDVTAPSDQSGNFIVKDTSGTAVYNEVIGDPSQGDVSKIRVNLNKNEQVEVSGMSDVAFTPVTAPFVTAHATTSLYAGSFTVGQDIGAGKYVVTPASGESGNFDVYDSNGNNFVNEILGPSSDDDDPSYTLTLSNGDIIQLQGIDSATFTAQ